MTYRCAMISGARGRTRTNVLVLMAFAIPSACVLRAAPYQNVPGTYAVRFCSSPCKSDDSSNVNTTGVLVLSNTPIALSGLSSRVSSYYRRLYGAVSRGAADPNTCWVLASVRRPASPSAALLVGFSSWTKHYGSVRLTLFRAPDSGYDVELHFSGDSVRGTGAFWSANDSPPGITSEEKIAGVRSGPPALERCIAVADSSPAGL